METQCISVDKHMEKHKALRIIISGGGTGGHIFPAISIANKMKELNPDSEILFVGAEGKMEMEKVPAAGYRKKEYRRMSRKAQRIWLLYWESYVQFWQ